MSPTQSEANGSKATPNRSPAPPRTVAAPADFNEVMREQLDYLIDHAANGACGCSSCERYLRARSVLLEIFTDPEARKN